MIAYDLIRSQRQTIGIYIRQNLTVQVRAPWRMPEADIDSFVRSSEKWIIEHLAQIEQQNTVRAAFKLNYGDTVLLMGKKYPINARTGNHAGFNGESFYLPPSLMPVQIKETLIQIYRNIAKKILSAKAFTYAANINIMPASVKITGAKTRWGSCSNKNSLNFSWRLIMADESVIDYVVVHELAHILEHNHSPRFWAIVKNILPDYQERQNRLKALQDKLSRENWD
ncbi:MAG: M48 family metallopeptidase [Firmicutes bacterium]|nr:M48 family metallopeptidase [Bacillota bacterium]